jgi:hypothetical protein
MRAVSDAASDVEHAARAQMATGEPIAGEV